MLTRRSPGRMLLVVLAVALSASGSAGASEPILRDSVKPVVPGVKYRKIVQDRMDRVIHILSINPDATATLDASVAGTSFPAYDLTRRMIDNVGGIAGVNGDFGLLPGRPAHAAAVDGELIQTSVLGGKGRAFAMSFDEHEAHIGRPRILVRLEDPAVGLDIEIHRWNTGPPDSGEVAGFTERGGRLSPPPTDACAARLTPAGARAWSADGFSIVSQWTVDRVQCASESLGLLGGIVVAARRSSSVGDMIASMNVGDSVTTSWSSGWRGVTELVGGSAILLRDGQVMVTSCDRYLCFRHPRTAVGVREDGGVILVVVDGRSFRSGGATLVGLARLMKDLGAVQALNLDGGGSSTMVVNGKVVNSPSDGHERAVTSALVVLPGPDAGETLDAGTAETPPP